MIDKDKISELRRLEEEATPGKWEVSEDNILINEDDEIGELILWSDKDIDLIVAMRNALPELLKALETPVDFPKILYVCEQCRETYPEMCGRGRDEIHVAPDGRWLCGDCLDGEDISVKECTEAPLLFALPPHGGVDVG